MIGARSLWSPPRPSPPRLAGDHASGLVLAWLRGIALPGPRRGPDVGERDVLPPARDAARALGLADHRFEWALRLLAHIGAIVIEREPPRRRIGVIEADGAGGQALHWTPWSALPPHMRERPPPEPERPRVDWRAPRWRIVARGCRADVEAAVHAGLAIAPLGPEAFRIEGQRARAEDLARRVARLGMAPADDDDAGAA